MPPPHKKINYNMLKREKEFNLHVAINDLPDLLKGTVNLMESSQEKYMGLFATSVLTGALMPHVWINYDGKVNHPALMLLVSFPPAAGKGKLALLPLVLKRINGELRTTNNRLMKKYMAEKRVFEKGKKTGNAIQPPDKPPLQLLLIPANTTSSKLTEQLAENNGDMMALLFETETDALTNMMGNKFGGDNSMIFRKVFHHEQISQMRKNNSEHLEAMNPKMAIVLTGTPSQVPKLFHSNQDGMLSRFMIISGTASIVWKDVQPCDTCVPLNTLFEEKADAYYKLFEFFKDRNVEVKFTDEQWCQLNETGARRLEHSNLECGENATSIAKRHGNMTIRLAAIFTMVRYFESCSSGEFIICTDQDFQIASWMAEQSYQCCIEIYKELPGEKSVDGDRLEEFFVMLPSFFQRRELSPLEKSLKISDSTVSRLLKKLVDAGRLASPKKGVYEKIEVTYLTDDRS
jgi:hypothetical protein